MKVLDLKIFEILAVLKNVKVVQEVLKKFIEQPIESMMRFVMFDNPATSLDMFQNTDSVSKNP